MHFLYFSYQTFLSSSTTHQDESLKKFVLPTVLNFETSRNPVLHSVSFLVTPLSDREIVLEFIGQNDFKFPFILYF